MDTFYLILKILGGWFVLRIVIRVFKKYKNKNKYKGLIQSAENRIKDFRKDSLETLFSNFEYLSEQIQLHPNAYKLYHLRAIISARLSVLVENKESAKKYYQNSSFDLKEWTSIASDYGGATTPAMDTQFVSNLRREGGKNKEFYDTFDSVADIGNGMSHDEAINQMLYSTALRNQKLENENK